MKLIQSIKSLRKGSFLRVVISKSVPTLKAYSDIEVVKQTLVTVCSGIEYDNQKGVIEKRESGEAPSENAGLPWGQWVEYPYLIEHKGKAYVRLYLKGVPQVTWKANGQAISKERAIELCGSKAKSSESKPECITVLADNVASAVQKGKELV